MPVNHADGTLFFSIVLYPIVTGKAALSAHAGWFTIFFVLASLPIGVAVIILGRKLVYWAVGPAVRPGSEQRGKWFQWAVVAPLTLVYIFLPYAVTAAGLCSVWFGTIWLWRHIM